jgi:hypothetical protein
MFVQSLPLVFVGLALVIVVAVGGAWIGGYFRHDVLTLRLSPSHSLWVESVRGSVQFVNETNTFPTMYETGWQESDPVGPLPSNTRCGFGWVSVRVLVNDSSTSRTIGITAIAVPPALFIVAFSLLAVAALRIWRRTNRRAALGLCSECGYDLRASSGLCPECGSPMQQPARP